MKKTVILSLLIIPLYILSSCSIEVEHSDTASYSRDRVNNAILSDYRTNTQEIVACKYIYNNDDFVKMYGNDFEIKAAYCPSEMENSLGFIKGTGECRVYINDDIWCVLLEKSYFSKWTVLDYFKCAVDPEDGDVIIDDNGEIVRAE